MMDHTVLKLRSKGLEEEFFAKHQEKLLVKIRQEAAKQRRIEALSQACGVSDEQVLEKMAAADLCCETVVAFALLPLLEVAWADGSIQDKERAAIMAAAAEHGIQAGTVACDMLESWLNHPLDEGLCEAWRSYVACLKETLDTMTMGALRHCVLDRAEGVASAAGGMLGIKSISSAEAAKLEELKALFD